MTNPVSCPRCGHTVFEVHITSSAVDFDVDVDGESKFLIDRAVLNEADSLELEAVCRNCGHVRFVPQTEWEWA